MEPRRFIRSGIAASALGHLSALTMVLISAEVHPFGSVTAEPITVDLVSPDEATRTPKKEEPPPEPKARPSDAFDLSSTSAPSSSPAPAAAQEPAARPQQQAALSTPRPVKQQANAQPQPPSTSPLPAFVPPEPDLSIKYHVMLGLPPDIPGDGFDAPASAKAEIASSLVTEFRRRLKTCSKLPVMIVPSDKIRITLRVLMTPEGKLAAEPILIEASASAKGPALMQSAITALQSCQPYTMLPADRYGEWKVLDLSFTPQDFAGPS
jgi:hypothetical protein